MASWRLAKALVTLRDQINAAYPSRSKKSDGTIGDPRHAARGNKSDHNPSNGIVHAIDLTHDPAGGFDAHAMVEHLRQRRDPRISYVISNRRIFSSTTSPWIWRKYNGSNPHTAHAHISVRKGTHADSTSLWSFRPPPKPVLHAFGALPAEEPVPKEEGDPTLRCYWQDVEVDPTDADSGELDAENGIPGPDDTPA